jgi:hypothetical protein
MIEAYTFGRIVINGTTYTKDLKIICGTVIPNWWRNSGHLVKFDDIEDIFKAGPETVVFGKGNPGQMRLTGSLQSLFQKNNIELIEAPTPAAVEVFNRLIQAGRNVSAGFHLTC